MHFTYAETIDREHLHQGDLLRRTDELQDVLREVHPLYRERSDDYRFFAVLTQSCDLVVRNGRCKSRYITLGMVRPIQLVYARELERFQRHPLDREARMCKAEHRTELIRFAQRLFNNNEPRFFFYRSEPTTALGQDHCAFLQLSIPLKAELHYDKLLAAKELQLSEAFEHKLGYLVGNLYSRIGTDDWVPTATTEERFRQLTEEVVDGLAFWVPDDLHEKTIKALKEVPAEGRADSLKSIVQRLTDERRGRVESALSEVAEVLAGLGITDQIIENTKKRLRARPAFTRRLK